ncbi:MAG: hypothetical protein H0T42_22405 [Deltaproteobacteria bacterium]|nr:hypothetical protein [Deltaproteobacteria bacterium]
MTRSTLLYLMLISLPLTGCGEDGGAAAPDAPRVAGDAPGDAPGGAVTLPTWKLEDVQPASPRVGQTYGLDSFTGRIIVVSLLEGF